MRRPTSKYRTPLALAREAKGLSRKELAELAGLHHMFIYKVERGERKLSHPSARALAEHLDIDPETLLED